MRRRWRIVFAVIDTMGSLLFGFVRVIRRQQRPRLDDPNQVQRILLVQLDHMGDAVLTLRTLKALSRKYPRASIDVLCSPWTAELFDAAREVSRVFVSHNNRFCRPRRATWWLSVVRWGYRLRGRRYDMAFDVRGEAPVAVLLWLTGARYRVGWACGGGDCFLTHGPAYVQNRPEINSRLALWSSALVGENQSSGQDRSPQNAPPDNPGRTSGLASENLVSRLRISDAARRDLERKLNRLPGNAHPRVVLHLGAGTMAKRWPLERWQTLNGELLRTLHSTVILIGGPEEQQLAATLTHERHEHCVVDWTGRLGLQELALLLDRADLFIGADSGPAHLAAAVQTPTVVLFSGTNNSQQWRPAGDHVRVVSHQVACSPCHRTECAWTDHPCMAGISPQQVLLAAQTLLKPEDASPDQVCPATALVNFSMRLD